MTARRLLLFSLMIASLLLAACNLSGEPEQEITLTPPVSATPTLSQQSTLGVPTGIAVTSLPILTPGVFPTSISFIPPTALAVVPSVTPSTISIVILSPGSGNVVSNNVQVLGSAIHPNFLQYQLEYGPEPNPNNLWYTIGAPRQSTVLNGVLGIWSTNTIPDGFYQLRLRVYLRDGSNPQTVVSNIRVQNTAPTAVPSPTNSIPRPIAAYSVDRSVGEAPLVVRFTNRSTGQISGYSWNFGDGSSSAEINPVHVFRTAGDFEVRLTVVGPGGQSNVSQLITVNIDPPVAQYDQNPGSGTAPLTVNFTDRSTGEITSWRWDFGDGTTSNERNPRHVFTTQGLFNISLRVRGPGGAHRAYSTINVTNPQVQPPVANFTPLNTGGNAPISIQFTDTSTGQVTSRLWEFGDGTTSTDQNPIHQFTTVGTFTVRLTVSGPGGTSNKVGQVVVNRAPRAPDAAFTANPQSGEAALVVSFTNATTGDVNGYRWSFGDGSATDTSTSPTHTFNVPGTYTVTLTALGPNGLQDTATMEISVEPPLVPPTADFAAQPTEGSAPLDVQFTNLSSGDDITSVWDFGDGETLETGESAVLHRYEANGTYTVTLTVSGPGGPTSSETGTITVTDRVQAAFTFGALTDPPGLGVAFQDGSTGQIASWAWDFGDGDSDTAQNPTHDYDAGGTYSVTLSVTGTDGVTSSVSQDVTVAEPLPAAPIANFSVSVENLTATFVDESEGEIETWTWDFGDGNASSEQSPVHEYAAPGTYPVRLIVENAGGSTELTQNVTVALPPPPAPVSEYAYTVDGLTVTLTDKSTGQVDSWFWEFGDGQSSTEPDPVHTYVAGGEYRIILTVANAGGSDSEGKNITIEAPPAAPVSAFTFETDNLNVNFSDASTGPVDTYLWDFGDGTTSAEQSPAHSYAEANTYTVTLTVSNVSGTNASSQDVTVTPPLPNAPTSSFTYVVNGSEVTFTDTSTGEGINRWTWEFDDGTDVSDQQNPVHSYAEPGTYRVRLTVANDGGEDRSGQDIVIEAPVPDAPVANFESSVSNRDVQFSDTSTGQIDTRLWDFGDGTTSAETNPLKQYQAAGTYSVTLTVTNAGGSNAITKDVVATDPLPGAPVAGFTASVNNRDVTFTDTSSGQVDSRLWDFGDGQTSTDATVTHTYAAAGTYTVTLTVNNAGGTNSTQQQVAPVDPLPSAPVAGFTASVNNRDVTFTDTSSGQVDSRLWDFGDGQTSTDATVTHTYAAAGTYTVTLTVNNAGGTNSTQQQVAPVDPLPNAPVAGFTASVNNRDVTFTDTSSGQVDSRVWDFGDGQTSTEATVTHTYAAAGTYTVTLTVNNAGGTNSTQQQVAPVDPLPSAPVAGFTASVNNRDVTFTDTSSGQVDSRLWDFGDGQTSTDATVTHTYAAAGIYTVTLTVNNAGGSNSTQQQVAPVDPLPNAPVAGFTFTPTNLDVQFSDLSTGPVDTWFWDFGDGTTSVEQNPFKQYQTPNTYTVTLTVTNAGGTNATQQQVTVNEALPDLPVADFAFTAEELTVTFTDASSGQITGYAWDFGDGQTSTDANPVITYAAANTYTVVLTVTNAAGSSSAQYDVAVESAPVEDSIADTTPVMPDLDNGVISNIFNSGGKAANAFVVVGDRSVSSGLFLVPFGDGQYELSQNGAGVEGVIQHYLNGDAGGVNSFDRVGSAVFADSGAAVFANNDGGCGNGGTVTSCEIDAANAAITIISLGYRDARSGTNEDEFRTNLQTIIDTAVNRGSVPVLLTPYTRSGEEAQIRRFAEIVIEVGDANNVPVLNVWRLVNEMPEGMSGSDLSVAGAGPDRLGENQIATFGENARNFYTLDLLRQILQAVGAL